MAFDSKGLFYAQMSASIEYALDQGILLDDYEHRLTGKDKHLDVEVYFAHPTRPKVAVADTEIKFVTMYQRLVYRFFSDSAELQLVESVSFGLDDCNLSQLDQLRLLTLAIEASAEFT